MKLLVVFVSALVLVAHGKVLSSADGEGVQAAELQAEDGSEYAAEESQPPLRVFGVEEQQRAAPQQSQRLFESLSMPFEFSAPTNIYLPVLTRSCTNSACAYVCSLLGFKYGVCASSDTCWCYN